MQQTPSSSLCGATSGDGSDWSECMAALRATEVGYCLARAPSTVLRIVNGASLVVAPRYDGGVKVEVDALADTLTFHILAL